MRAVDVHLSLAVHKGSGAAAHRWKKSKLIVDFGETTPVTPQKTKKLLNILEKHCGFSLQLTVAVWNCSLVTSSTAHIVSFLVNLKHVG